MPPTDVLGVFKQVQDAIRSVLANYRLTLRSGGTKDLALRYNVDSVTGFWDAASGVTSKPPRWILQIEEPSPPTAHESRDPSGTPFVGAYSPGFIYNSDANCVAIVFRILAAVRPAGQTSFEFPGWEWLLVLGFDNPLPIGTSSELLTNFNPVTGTIEYKGRGNRQTYPLAIVGLVTAPIGTPIHPAPPASSSLSISYADATDAIDLWLHPAGPPGAKVYDGTSAADLQRLAGEFDALFATGAAAAAVPISIAPNTSLLGVGASTYRQIDAALSAGKKHLIFYGPPGTGKTTLAQYVARELSPDPSQADAFTMLTASTSWSSQDLIGGYQPTGPGQIDFIPGILLRNFDRPLVIDELNRCPIDKVISPLFSILSGQATTLPYRVKVADPKSDFYAILPAKPPTKQSHEFAPEPHWRMICTLNTIDKTQLGQISYALSRRFAWIKVGVPEDLEDFVATCCYNNSLVATKPTAGGPSPVAAMWQAVNAIREIGGAPIIDFIKAVYQMDPNIDLFAALSPHAQAVFLDALRMYILPLMDGILRSEAEELGDQLSSVWSLDPSLSAALKRDLRDIAA